MAQWTATREELEADFERMAQAHVTLEPVETNARIFFHDSTQEAVKVITPAPRFIAALMAGGVFRRVRCIGTDTPEMEGDDSGETMGPMTHDEAVAFVAWRDLPAGCNHFAILHTDDIPRVDGCIDRARKLRAAWRLEEAA